jgi:hypothetical protein
MINGSPVVALLAALTVTACVVSPGPPGYGGVVVAPLPAVVELGPDPYYYHSGRYYFYEGNHWRYSSSRAGPWVDLPRSHWPKETRYKGRGRDDDRHRDSRYDHDSR